MTLFEDIGHVHDGVLKAPPFTNLTGNVARMRDNVDVMRNEGVKHDRGNEKMYKMSLNVAIDAVRCMQLASSGMDKEARTNHADELSGLTNAEDVRKATSKLNREPDYLTDVIELVNEYAEKNGLEKISGDRT